MKHFFKVSESRNQIEQSTITKMLQQHWFHQLQIDSAEVLNLTKDMGQMQKGLKLFITTNNTASDNPSHFNATLD